MFHNQNGIPDFTTIDNLYLAAVCSGIQHTFGDIKGDPMYETDKKSLTLCRHVLTTNCRNARDRIHYKCLHILEEVRADFCISNKRRQLEILKTLEFEYRSWTLACLVVQCVMVSS